MRTLVLGLGNELLADDGVGIAVARLLKPRLEGVAEVTEATECGIALMEYFLDFDRAIVVDAVQTGNHPVGEFFEIDPSGLPPCVGPSPHYTGLPEMFEISKQLDLKFPWDVRIVAIEVEDVATVGGEMSKPVQAALPRLVKHIEKIVADPRPIHKELAGIMGLGPAGPVLTS